MAVQAPSAADVDRLFQQAFKLHGEGELRKARKIYERIFSVVRGHPGAMQMLASIAYYEGDETQAESFRDAAIRYYRDALARVPQDNMAAAMQLRAGLVNVLLSADQVQAAETEAQRLWMPLSPIFLSPEDWRYRRLDAINRKRPRIVLNTLPKSASETVWNRLAAGLNTAQAHVSLGLFPNCLAIPSRLRDFQQGGVITKEHLAPTDFNANALRAAGVDRVVVHLRDPRQVTLSWAHFVREEISRTPLGPLWRQTCPPRHVLDADLETLLDWCIEHYLPQVVAFVRGWQRIQAAGQPALRVRFTTFEGWLDDPDGYLREVLRFYDVGDADQLSRAEARDGHFRRGRRDEWREVFTAQQCRRANALLPRELADAFGWPA